ncbi:MAG: CoA transferase [Dehalococcoidia bacterium]
MLYPLQGIRAIDCGVFHAGPGALAILAELGAEVIKIEQPRIGDPVRELMAFGTTCFEFKGRSLFFEGANRNKKSITLDLKNAKGQEIMHRLVAKCDVFLTNYRKDAVERLGLTYPALRKFNSSLIYAYVSGNGSRGPDSKRGGFDQQGQARSGLMFSVGDIDMPPLLLQFGVMDQTTAIVVSHGILTALLMKERFGIGQEIDASLLGSAMFAQYFNVMMPLVTGMEVPRYNRMDTDPLRNYYCCQDGKWLSIQAIPRHADSWDICCLLIGRPELKADPRFDTDRKRMENRNELILILDEIFATKPRDEWHRLFGQYDFISCPVNKPSDLQNDPQVIENGYIADCDHQLFGKTRMPGYPIRFSEAQTCPHVAAPELGAHTEEVLREIGGCTDDEIQQLREEGVI